MQTHHHIVIESGLSETHGSTRVAKLRLEKGTSYRASTAPQMQRFLMPTSYSGCWQNAYERPEASNIANGSNSENGAAINSLIALYAAVTQ